MKIDTAIRNALKIRDRVRSVGGIFATPECRNKALVIKRVWVFGSTVKGSENPNDLDILIDYRISKSENNKQNTKKYKRGFRRGLPIYSHDVVFKSIKKGMQRVSIHEFECDNGVGDIDSTKIMIYPRFDLELSNGKKYRI